MRHHQTERGQTITFYLFAIILALGLSLFVSNYTNMVRWHVRAQNAADEVALASLADEASLENERTMALYSTNLAGLRAQTIGISMMNAANSSLSQFNQSTSTNNTSICNDSAGADDSGYDCDNAYDQQPPFYDAAVSQYAAAVSNLEALASPTMPPEATPPPGYPTNQPSSPANSTAGAAYSIAANGSSCQNGTKAGTVSGGAFDCAFWYNANLQNTGPGTIESVEVIACRKVSAAAPGFLKLFGSIFPSNFQFNAIALAAATLVPVSENFDPGTEKDPDNTPNPYAPIEACPPTNLPAAFGTPGPCAPGPGWMSSKYYDFDASPLTVHAVFYVVEPTSPQFVPGNRPSANCEQG